MFDLDRIEKETESQAWIGSRSNQILWAKKN